jgi:hypothetical protein
MWLSLKRLTDTSRKRLLADPKEIALCFDWPTHTTSVQTPTSSGGFFRKLFGKKIDKADKDVVKDSPERDPHFDEPECNLEKSWDVLCFLFCGATWSSGADEKSFPSNFLCMGKNTVNVPNDFLGYGPPWMFSSQEVKEIAGFLEIQTEEQLRIKYVPSALGEADAYPAVWDDYEDESWEEDLKYYFEVYLELKEFVRETANRNLALLLYLA